MRNATSILAWLALLSLGAFSAPATAVGLSNWGTSSILTFRDCTGVAADVECSSVVGSFSTTFGGGLFQTLVESRSIDGFGSVGDLAEFSGQAGAPVLSAESMPSDISRNGATTLAVQGYTYTGTSTASVLFGGTLDYFITDPGPGIGSGGTFGGIYALDPTVDFDFLLDCVLVELCLEPGAILAGQSDGSFNDATGGSFSKDLMIALDLNPGDTFYIAVLIQAVADRGGEANTELLNLAFDGPAGFLDDLTPATLKAVPLPAGAWLLLSAIGVLRLSRRRGR